MKTFAWFIIIFTLFSLCVSFYVKFGSGDENAVVQTSGLLKHLETFPRENFDNLMNLLDDFDEIGQIITTQWYEFDSIGDYIEFIGQVFYSIWLMIRALFLFIYYSMSYAGDIVIWVLKIPIYLIKYTI